jgi:hypothetical protein
LSSQASSAELERRRALDLQNQLNAAQGIYTITQIGEYFIFYKIIFHQNLMRRPTDFVNIWRTLTLDLNN